MVDLEEVERAMIRHESPVVTTSDLADELDCTSRHVHDQLQLLQRADAVESRKVGARARAWWHESRVTPPRLPPEDDPDQTPLDDHGRRDDPDAERVERDRDEDDDLADDLARVDVHAEGELAKRRRDAVRAMYELIRENGSASRSNFLDEIYPNFEVGYSASSFWNYLGKEGGLSDLAELRDDLRAPSGEGAHQWRFVGEK